MMDRGDVFWCCLGFGFGVGVLVVFVGLFLFVRVIWGC